MKQKSHSGAKKRLKVRSSGSAKMEKAGKRHLLVNKSKKQKKSFPGGMPLPATRMMHLRRLLPGKLQIQSNNIDERAAAKSE